MAGWVSYDVWVYNLATLATRARRQQITKDRAAEQVTAELEAILGTYPGVVGLVEAVGHSLPQVPGYRLVRNRSSRGHANVAAYVRLDLPVSRVRWRARRETWGRTKHPGRHESRVDLALWVGRVKVVIGHQPPKGTDNTIAAQAEGIRRLTRMLTTTPRVRPVAALLDANRRPGEAGPGPTQLARRIGGRVVGRRIDCAVVRGMRTSAVSYVGRVGGVRLRSDHPHALRFTVSIRARWVRPPKKRERKKR